MITSEQFRKYRKLAEQAQKQRDAFFRLRGYAPTLLEAAKKVVANWEKGDLASAVRELSDVIQQIEGT